MEATMNLNQQIIDHQWRSALWARGADAERDTAHSNSHDALLQHVHLVRSETAQERSAEHSAAARRLMGLE
jgi:hypothetical protein